MASISLQFQGVQDPQLPLLLVGAIVVVLIGWGVRQLVGGRRRYGLLCLAAAFTPLVFVPVMVIDAAGRYARGNRRGGAASLLAAVAAGLATAGGLLLTMGARGGFWMALVAVEVALAVGVFYSSVYAYLGRKRLLSLMALRCAGVLALMLILFKPALSFTDDRAADKPALAILVDRSGSMGATDRPPSRFGQSIRMLLSQADRIERNFSPRWYHFARSARPAESVVSMAELPTTGEGTEVTNLAAAINTAARDLGAASLVGIVLLTDGVHNAGGAVTDAAIAAQAPIHPVVVGSTEERPSGQSNIELTAVDAPLDAVVNNITKITVKARVTGFATVPLEVQLFEQDKVEPVDTQRLWTDKNDATLTAEFKWTARRPAGSDEGANELVQKLRIVLPPNPAESVQADNETELHVLLTEPRIRVLYVEGSMRPEYKYLKRLLDSDPNIRFLGLIRIVDGAGDDDRYWSQGNISGKKLSHLPTSDADFELFDVIVLGDLEAESLKGSRMTRIRKFVEDGGALLMLGGHRSFGPGGYEGTDIEAVLPVDVGPKTQSQETTPFVPQLTSAGEAHPIFGGIQEFFPGPGGRKPNLDLPQLTDLLGCVAVLRAKPTASLLALHPTRKPGGRPLPVLAVQRVGKGRAAAFTADTTWQWYMRLEGMGRENPYQRFWGQMIRWLADVEGESRESKPSVVMRLDKTYLRLGAEPLNILARVQDDKGQPVDKGQVTCTVTPIDHKAADVMLTLSPRMGDRLFESQFSAPRAGKYRLEVAATDAAGKRLGADQQEVTVVPHSKEMDRLARDDALLGLLADKTRGQKVELSGLPDLIDRLVEQQEKGQPDPRETASVYKLFDFTLLFLAFICLLSAEWFLRRQWNLR